MNHSSKFKSLSKKASSDVLLQRRVEEGHLMTRKRREEQIEKHRNISLDSSLDQIIDDIEMLDVSNVIKFEIREEWVKKLFSPLVYDQVAAVGKIARFLLKNPSRINEVLKRGIVPRLLELLVSDIGFPASNEVRNSLKTFTAQILADVSILQVENIFPLEFLAPLIDVLSTNFNFGIKLSVIMILGNLAVESEDYRKLIRDYGVMPVLRGIIKNTTNLRLMRNALWALVTLCRTDEPPTNFNEAVECVLDFTSLVHHTDYTIVSEACTGLKYLSQSSKLLNQALIDCGTIPRLIHLLDPNAPLQVDYCIVTPTSLDVISEIAAGTEDETQELITFGVLPALKKLLTSPLEDVVSKVCRIMSNIAAGPKDQIQAVIDINVFSDIFKLTTSESIDIKIQAVYVIRQCISRDRTTMEQVKQLVAAGCIPVLCQILGSAKNAELLSITLRALSTVLTFDSVSGNFQKEIAQHVPFDILSLCESHEEYQVRKYATRLQEKLR